MTKTTKKILTLFLIVLLVFAILPFNTFTASAGESKNTVSNSSITESGINNGNWYFRNVDVENAHAVFNNQEAILSSKTLITSLAEYDLDHCFDAKFALSFSRISNQGLSVGVCVDKINFSTGFNGALEFVFADSNNKVGLTIKLNNQDGTSSEVLASKTFQLNSSISIDLSLNSYGKFIVKANDELLVEKQTNDFEIGGYFGFKSSRGTVATLDSIDMTFYKYENAKTLTEYNEDFNNGYFNSNVWYITHKNSVAYPDSMCSIVDGKLLAKETNQLAISSLHQYSNFEFRIDITDMRRQSYELNGYTYPMTGFFGLGFGIGDYSQYYSQTIQNELWFEFDRDNSRYILFDEDRGGLYSAYDVQPFAPGHNYWKESDVKGRTINLKFTMINGVFSFYGKYEDQEWSETPLYSFDMGYTPLGAVRFTGHHVDSYMELDNLYIKNLDYNAEDFAVSVDYKQNITSYEPVEYVDTWDDSDLLKEGAEMSKGCVSSIKSDSLIICATLLLVGTGILMVRKKESK